MWSSDVTKALFFQTGSYDKIGLRPLANTTYTRETANSLYEHTKGGTDITASSIAPIASDILTLQTESSVVANIVNGFDTQRFRFLLEFTEQSGLQGTSGVTKTIFVGYTDHPGAVLSGAVDRNMRLYFNNAVQLREVTMQTPMGPRKTVNTSYSNQLLHNPTSHDYMSGAPNIMTLRPEDIFALMQYENQAEFNELSKNGMISANSLVGVTANARTNLNPAVYLANTMNAFQHGMTKAMASGDDFDIGDAYASARDHSRTAVAGSRVSVLRHIMSSTNFPSFGYVTYGELCSIFPSFDHVADIKLISTLDRSKIYQPGQGANWMESSNNAWLASQMQMSVPAIMNDTMLQFIHVMATNDTIGGAWDIRPVQPGKSMVDGLDQTVHLQAAMSRIVEEVLKPITHYGLMKLSINMCVDLFGDAVFMFNYDGAGDVSFTSPSFCDALYSSVLTTNTQNLVGLKTDIETMLMDINGDVSRMDRERAGLSPMYSMQNTQPIHQPIHQPPQNRTYDPTLNLSQAIDLSFLNNTGI